MKFSRAKQILNKVIEIQNNIQNTNRLFNLQKINPKIVISFFITTQFILGVYICKKSSKEFQLKFSMTRCLSKMMGKISELYIPKFLRPLLFGTYIKLYNVRVEDMDKNISDFKSFQEFFTRSIITRQIENQPKFIVSPVDSTVLTIQEVEVDQVNQVKGIKYRLGELLTGIEDYEFHPNVIQSMKKKENSKLLLFNFYLSPGDYHRYHAPCDFVAKKRLLIQGFLNPVMPSYVSKYEKIYETNERVCVFGEGLNGFISLIFIGALNVGSIQLNFDKTLDTNKKQRLSETNKLIIKDYSMKNIKDTQELIEFDTNIQEISLSIENQSFKQTYNGIKIAKGEEMGMFKFGSTVIMLLEVSKDSEILVKSGDNVRYGQSIIKIPD